jgi:hypothetical protein
VLKSPPIAKRQNVMRQADDQSNSSDGMTDKLTNLKNKMTRNITIASRLREVLLNGHWIANTNYSEQIQSVNWQQATQKVDNLNTIAALTYHINYYLAGLLNAFEIGKLEISDRYSFDLPPISSETDWNKLVTDFLDNSEKFANKVEQMEDYIFDKPFIDEKYGTFLRNIEGVIEHSYYHLGQISLIRKMITQNKS